MGVNLVLEEGGVSGVEEAKNKNEEEVVKS